MCKTCTLTPSPNNVMEDIRYREKLLCMRECKPEDTVVSVGRDVSFGSDKLVVIAGPCSVESEEQIIGIAGAVKEAGADMLRGGAYKPRTSPYDFQGLEAGGIKMLLKAKKETGLPIITEIMDPSNLDLFSDIDVLQVGARNMQNYALLKALGKTDKPILLKRGISATYMELLTAAEYILSEGNPNVILCERGIRTFETYTRNTLDVAAVPVLKGLSHLPTALDPSHACGRSELVGSLALAAVAAGADGLMIEVHNDPEHALSDGRQSITPEQFKALMTKIKKVEAAVK